METIGETRLCTFLSDGWSSSGVTSEQIRRDSGFIVNSYHELVRCVAKLAFFNRDHVLLFRGQRDDKRTSRERTTLQPSMFRNYVQTGAPEVLRRRYDYLSSAENLLVEKWRGDNEAESERVARQRILRWAILQHYEVCPTPLLDVTQSLRIAASFASLERRRGFVHLFVLAVPQLSGAITASAEAGLQIVRLSSICPPSALRPHFQEGYLLTEYPEIQDAGAKRQYARYEIDCARRLIAHFQISLDAGFWSDKNFPRVKKNALYPTSRRDDWLDKLTKSIKDEMGKAP